MKAKELQQLENISGATDLDEFEHRNERVAIKAYAIGAQATGSHAIGAQAIGSLAVGALAFGVLAIWRLAISQLFVRKSRFVTLEIEELVINRLRVDELTITGKLDLPDGGFGK